MANEPSLSELSNITADPERGTGTPAFVIDNRELVRNLNQTAQIKAEYDWKKYNLFLNNLKDVYKDIGDVSGIDVATQDHDMVKNKLGEILQEVAADPRGFFSGKKMAEIQGKIASVRRDATESKLNRVYDMAHREYLTRNPELNTPENQKKVDEYLSQPLGKRKPYTLDMPPLFDYTGMSEGIKKTLTRHFAESGLVDDGKMIRERTGTRLGKNDFMNAWMGALEFQQDKYGHPIKSAIEKRFSQLPENVQQYFGNDPNKFYRAMGEQAFNSDKDIEQLTKDELKPNPQIYQNERLKLERDRLNLQWAKLHNVDEPKAKAQIDRWKAMTKGSEDNKNNSLGFANKIYSELQSLADADGVITPDKARQLTSEQLKYLGTGQTGEYEDKDPNTKKTVKYKGPIPLRLGDKDIIQIKDGKVMVMRVEGLNKKTGRYYGKWDKTSSTTLSNIATHRLNEELKTAGNAKELNAYDPVDEMDLPENGEIPLPQSESAPIDINAYMKKYNF